MKTNYIRIILQKVRVGFYVLFYPFVKIFVRQKDNEVLFLSDSREDFSGNFLYVKEEIEKRGNYNINSLLKKSLKTKKTFSEKMELLKAIARAKYIFLDDFYPIIYALRLGKKKELIQLWHALGSFKTVGYARFGKPGGPKGYNLTHRNYTGAIVSSESIRGDYARAFGISIDKVHALGIPRTDIFYDGKYSSKIKNEIYKKYPMLKNKTVMMFAPTFRGKGQGTAHYDFSMIDFNRIKKEFSKDYVCIIKFHPFIKNRPDYDFTNDDFYLDLSSEREINDLLFVTDLLITDYSSVIFEYSFFKKSLIFYVPDFDDYVAARSFFYDFEKYNYGVRANNMDELIKCIRNSKPDLNKIKEFYDYFCSACDGNSTKRVVDYFLGDESK